MLTAIIAVGAVALFFAITLGLAAKKFHVEVDPRELAISEVLPGANCGGCGLPGCSAFAKGCVEGTIEITGCPPGGAGLVEKIAGILGVTADASEAEVAVVICQGDNVKAKNKYKYLGIEDCNAAQQIAGGPKTCPGGCMGLGTCQRVCPFDAIEITEDGLAVIDREKCTGCQKCVPACPRKCIVMAPISATTHVMCNSNDKGPAVKKYCTVGCIGCTLCKKKGSEEGYVIENFLARVDYEKKAEDINAGIEVCPTKCIRDFATEGYPEGSKLVMPNSVDQAS